MKPSGDPSVARVGGHVGQPAAGEEAFLSAFCVGRFGGLEPILHGLVVSDLRGYTEEKLMKLVEDWCAKKGVGEERHQLVPPLLLHEVSVDGKQRTLATFLASAVEVADQEVYPAPVAPSSVKEEDLKSSFVVSSVIEQYEFVELLSCLSEGSPNQNWIGRANELVMLLDRLRGRKADSLVAVSHHELFANDCGCSKLELAYSSVIGSFLARNMPELWSFHQMPARRGTSDILLCCCDRDIGGKFSPLCVIECGMGSKSEADMRKSLRGYAVNFCPIVPVGKYFLGVELLDVDSTRPYIRVKAFFRINNDARVHEVMLWNGKQAEFSGMWARLMEAIVLAARHNFHVAAGPRTTWRVLTKNVGANLKENLIFKVFDYRDRWDDVGVSSRRDPVISQDWIPNCKVVAHQQDFTLISYPIIEGNTTARYASEFVPLFEQLEKLHAKGLVHGDIRAYNMLFPRTGGILIDFDYSGKDAVKQYPDGFWTDLPDTKRHKRAVAGALLRKEHDCFSLGAVLSFYACETDVAGWKELVESLQCGRPDLDQSLARLRRIGNASVKWLVESVIDPFGESLTPARGKTSSPTKK
jgi:hypothetical protein